MAKRFTSIISPSAFRAMVQAATPESRVIPVDSTWYMPNNPSDGFSEFKEARLPDAVFFDVDKVSDTSSAYPHMLPSVAAFNAAVSGLGLKASDKLVFYDKLGIFSSPRAAWTFGLFGHREVYILNHWPLYCDSAFPLDKTAVDSPSALPPATYEGLAYTAGVILYEELVALVQAGEVPQSYQLIDARSHDRFTAAAPEPRPELSSGHIPGAKSLPFQKVRAADGRFLEKGQLEAVFAAAGIDPNQKTIVMCGSGVTACVVKAALDVAGYGNGEIIVYDGSWTEWASRAPRELIVSGP